MSFFGKPSGSEPRITYERIDLANEPPPEPLPLPPGGSARLLAERLEPRSDRARAEAAMVIAADSEMEGRLVSRGPVRVEGVLRGALEAPLLLLEPGGLVEGQVTVDRLRAGGTLRGAVLAREIEVLRHARIEAELTYDEICVERGARVSGLHRQRQPDPPPLPEAALQDLEAALLAETLPEPAPLPTAPLPAAPSPATPPPAAPLAPLEPAAAAPVAVAAPPPLPATPAADAALLTAVSASTAALVAEAEAAMQDLAQMAQAAAGAAAELAVDGVSDLVELEVALRATPLDLPPPPAGLRIPVG